MAESLRQAADRVFAAVSPYPGQGLRNHNLRLYELTRLVMRTEGIEFHDDTAYAIAMAHDLGLVSERDEGPDYMQRSLALYRRELSGGGSPEADEVIAQCLLLNHQLLPVPGACPAAEAFRKAVWIEHSRGLRRYGRVSRADVAQVFARHPRDNLDAVLLDFARRTLRREPRTLARAIFLGGQVTLASDGRPARFPPRAHHEP